MKITKFSKCGLWILLLVGSECVAAETAGRGQEVATWRRQGSYPTGVAFSPEGRHVATGSQDGTATVWDLSNGTERLTVPGHRGPVWSVAYSPSGGQFLTGAGDGENNGKLWNAESGALVQTYPPAGGKDWLESGPLRGRTEGHGQRVEVVGFSPDGKRVLTGSHDGRVIVWDAGSGRFLLTLGEYGGPWIHAAGFSPDGRTIAVGDYAARITVWDAQSGICSAHRNVERSLRLRMPKASSVQASDELVDIGGTRNVRSLCRASCSTFEPACGVNCHRRWRRRR